MEKINLSSIKRESVKSIFNAIAEQSKVSRSDISKETGLSLMTVGKVIDALLERNIIRQSKEIKVVAGRKAGLVNLNIDNFIIVLDLTSRNFVMSIVDIGLNIVDTTAYDYNHDFYYEENLYIFLKNVKIYMLRRLDMDRCIGIGVSLPGPYFPETDTTFNLRIPELTEVPICTIMEEVLKQPIDFIEKDVRVAALSNVTSIPNYRNLCIAYVYIGEGIGGAIVVKGEVLQGARLLAGDIGQTIVSRGRNLEECILSSPHLEDSLDELTTALFNLSWLIDPHVIIIECNKQKTVPHLDEILTERLNKMFPKNERAFPEIVLSVQNVQHSHCGIALKLREQWLDKVIM